LDKLKASDTDSTPQKKTAQDDLDKLTKSDTDSTPEEIKEAQDELDAANARLAKAQLATKAAMKAVEKASKAAQHAVLLTSIIFSKLAQHAVLMILSIIF
jgi:hypothetical protein